MYKNSLYEENVKTIVGHCIFHVIYLAFQSSTVQTTRYRCRRMWFIDTMKAILHIAFANYEKSNFSTHRILKRLVQSLRAENLNDEKEHHIHVHLGEH